MAQDVTTTTVTYPEPAREALVRAFGPFSNNKEEQEALQRFAVLAVTALTDWVTGKKRYRTLTEQYIDWVEQVYVELLPQDEAPSTDRIYNSLNMPHGQASYIARVLAAKTLVHWRQLATAELRTALQAVEKDARGYIKEGDQSQAISLQVGQVALNELTRVCSERWRRDRSYMMPQTAGGTGDCRFVSVPSCTIVDLLDNLQW